MPEVESLPYYEQAERHLDSGYPKLWASWLAFLREVKQYNEGIATRIESSLQAEVISRMNRVFPPDVTHGLHQLRHDFWIDHITGAITAFWNARIEGSEAPFRLEPREGTTGVGSVVMRLNGIDVYWTTNKDELRPAEDSLVELALSMPQMWSMSGDSLTDQFFTAHETYKALLNRLSEFQRALLIPIKKTFEDEGYLEGKCNRCPTVWRLFRKYFT